MSENMMNTTATVTARDIAAKLGKSISTVRFYLGKQGKARNNPTSILINSTAEKMGYDGWNTRRIDFSKVPQKIDGRVTQTKIAEIAGTTVMTVCRALNGGKNKFYSDIRKLAAMYGYENMRDPAVKAKRETEKAERKAKAYYYNSPFHTAEERKEYMIYLRNQGYGNFEIARKAGTVPKTVRYWIGNEPAELAKHNRTMAAHIRKQKNAARKVYICNQKVADFNAKAEQHNAIKAEAERLMAQVKQMEATLKPEEQTIAAMTVPAMPSINLKTIQPTALQ